MYEHPLEDIHRMIDTVEEGIRRLESWDRPGEIPVTWLADISEAVIELLGWTNTGYMENELGIQSSVLNKFVKGRGRIQKHVARAVADRLRSYLKSQDQAFLQPDVTPEKKDVAKPEPPAERPVQFAGQSWVAVKITSDISQKIGAISALLDSIIHQVKHANAPSDEQIMTEIERQQLIAILQTALNILKSPMVEKGLLRKAQSILRKGAESAAEKVVQEGLGHMMGAAGDRIGELIGMIFS